MYRKYEVRVCKAGGYAMSHSDGTQICVVLVVKLSGSSSSKVWCDLKGF